MIGRVLAVAIGLFSGLAGAQMPEFAQQYRQNLAGRIDELRRIAARFEATASAGNLTREEAIRRLQASDDPVIRGQGQMNEEIAARLVRFQQQRDEYDAAGPFGRLLVFVRNADPDIAQATYLNYEPAWPATTEGAAAGGAGFVAGWGVLLFLSRIAGRLSPWRRRRPGLLRSA